MFQISQSVNPTASKPNLLKFYGYSAYDFVSKRLNDTKFCESIILPTEFTLKKSFEATFFNAKTHIHSSESDRVDLCCRSLHKCDAHKRILLNYTNESCVRNCECEYSFVKCLENLNSSLSNELAFVHSINTTKCYAKDYPIIKCKTFDAHQIESKISSHFKFLDSAERESLFNRCSKYDLDQSRPQQIQIFDVPFNNHAMSAIECKLPTGRSVLFS